MTQKEDLQRRIAGLAMQEVTLCDQCERLKQSIDIVRTERRQLEAILRGHDGAQQQ